MLIPHFFRKKYEQYTGIRFSATGIFGYTYRNHKNEEVFHILCPVMPNPDISMNGFHQELVHRNFNGQITLFPGVRREITDKSGNLWGYYEFVNGYEFRMGSDIRASVRVTEYGWEVHDDFGKIAEVRRIPGEKRTRYEENGYDMEPFFHVTVASNTNPAFLPYIFTIPMLGF